MVEIGDFESNKGTRRGYMKDFLVFRRMVTPILIQIIYWIATVIVIVFGLYLLINGEGSEETIRGLLVMILGPLGVRIYAEILMLLFRMNETLTDIKNNTARN